MPSGAPPTDERLTAVTVHGRGMMPATRLPITSSPTCLPTCTHYDHDCRPQDEQPGTGKAPARIKPKSQGRKLLHSPGIVAVSLYMLLLAFAVIVDVVKNHFPSLFLVFPVLFIAAGLGLLKLFRWAWALTLAAVAMFAGLFLLDYTSGRLFPSSGVWPAQPGHLSLSGADRNPQQAALSYLCFCRVCPSSMRSGRFSSIRPLRSARSRLWAQAARTAESQQRSADRWPLSLEVNVHAHRGHIHGTAVAVITRGGRCMRRLPRSRTRAKDGRCNTTRRYPLARSSDSRRPAESLARRNADNSGGRA